MKTEPGDSVNIRAVKGVLAGHVVGKLFIYTCYQSGGGGVEAGVAVSVTSDAIDKMLADERKAARAKKAKRKGKR